MSHHNIPLTHHQLFPAINSDKEFSIAIYTWWAIMSLVSIINIGFWFYICWHRAIPRLWTEQFLIQKKMVEIRFVQYQPKELKDNVNYKNIQVWLSFLFVTQCAWRSFFPEMYNERIVYWDSPMSSVFLGRALATFGEVAWITQVALCLFRCQTELKCILNEPNKYSEIDWFILASGFCSILMCTAAEFFCNKAMFTINYIHNVIETCLWTISFIMLTPCAIYIYYKTTQIKNKNVDSSLIKIFAIQLSICGICFVGHLILDHIPLQYKMYQESLKIDRKLMTLSEGLESTIYHRIVSKSWTDWKDDYFWMLTYFTFGVWSSIYMAKGPGLMVEEKYNKQRMTNKDE